MNQVLGNVKRYQGWSMTTLFKTKKTKNASEAPFFSGKDV
jgi:hypothetical protein